MSLYEARRLLDAARAGCDIPTEQITEALCETGDLSWIGTREEEEATA